MVVGFAVLTRDDEDDDDDHLMEDGERERGIGETERAGTSRR